MKLAIFDEALPSSGCTLSCFWWCRKTSTLSLSRRALCLNGKRIVSVSIERISLVIVCETNTISISTTTQYHERKSENWKLFNWKIKENFLDDLFGFGNERKLCDGIVLFYFPQWYSIGSYCVRFGCQLSPAVGALFSGHSRGGGRIPLSLTNKYPLLNSKKMYEHLFPKDEEDMSGAPLPWMAA